MFITLNEKGMIKIPEKIREELCLKTRERFEIGTEGKKMTLLPSINPEDFIVRMEGKLKSGNKTVSPAEIKSIWII
jgi:bifunctional DNA-binding transcriptional regulator/antitoxin component of YhaV-PrlF toxin-antitoxin module